MTVSSTTTKVSYSGDGSTTVFAYTFKVFNASDLVVIKRTDSTGSESVQTITTNYTVSGVGNANGGNVTFTTAPSTGETVVIRRTSAQTQTTDYTPNDPFPAETHEEALDKLTFIVQEQQEELDRAIKVSRTNTITTSEFTVGATDRANRVFAFDSDGDLSVTQEIGTYQGTDTTTTTSNYQERDLIKSTTAAELNNVYICVADSEVGDLLTDTDHFELIVDAVSAATSATNAATSETNASTSASTATTKASEAATSATNAATSATSASTAQTAAETAQTAAETAQAAAETALDTFDDRFLGAKATDPTVDNDGNALIDGALYFDTTNDIMKVYDLTNTQWRQLTLTSSNQTNVNTVAGQISPTNNIATVAGITANIGTVAGISADVTSVAGVSTEVGRLGTADAVADMNTLGTAAIVADMDALADISANITTVAGISSDVTTVAGDSADIQTLADNIGTISSKANAGANSDITSMSGLTGDVNYADNAKSVYGAGNDLQIYHDGSNSYFTESGTGRIYITTNGPSVILGKTNGENMLIANADGAVDIYHNNVKKLATNSGGVDITGELQADSLDIDGAGDISGNLTLGGNLDMGDSDKILLGTGDDLEIFHDGSNSYIKDVGTGSLYLQGTDLRLRANNADTYISCVQDGAVGLRHNNSEKVATTANGITVTGTAIATTNTDTTNTGSVTLDFGANQNFVLTLTGNVTLANPSTEQVGQSGFIIFIQDSTGSRTVSLGTDYETAGGAGLTLSTAASSVDIVPYVVQSSGNILLGAPQLAFS